MPFSGLAYHVAGDGIVGPISVVADGVVTGTSDDWIDVPPGGSRVDWDSLDEDAHDPARFRDVRFTGVAYCFEKSGECTRESEYRGGRRTELSERAWYRSGAPKEVIGGGEHTEWFEDGRLKRKATARDGVSCNLIPREDGRLVGIELNDAALFDLARVSRMTLAEEFMLLGSAIDTNLLRRLRDDTKLDAVAWLKLIETSIDSTGLGIIVSLPGLARLQLEGNSALELDEAQEIKRQRPGCVVELDGDEVP